MEYQLEGVGQMQVNPKIELTFANGLRSILPAGMELGMRLRGFTSGLFGWLRNAPWGDPGFSSLVFSVVVFGFVGGITGVTIGTEQINIIAHNTLRVPGHFHATVVSGTAMAFMGATYYLLPLIWSATWRLQGRAPGQQPDFEMIPQEDATGTMDAPQAQSHAADSEEP